MVNDYDKFAKMRQEQLQKGQKRPHRFLEKPMMRELLPDLSGKKVLMLGCGTGEETLILTQYGGKDMIGVDNSAESIRLAKETYPEFEFIVADMHSLPFEDETFDFVYSSLVVHYSGTPNVVYDEVNRVLKKGGKFLFSIGHPMRWASENVEFKGKDCKILGFQANNEDGEVYGNYNTFAKHDHYFPKGEVLSFYVGAPSYHFKLLKKSGFVVEDFSESKCIEEAKEIDFNYYSKYVEFPQFMAFLATKN